MHTLASPLATKSSKSHWRLKLIGVYFISMKASTLVYSIVGIFILFTGAYFVVSPIATRTLDTPIVGNVAEAPAVTETEPAAPSDLTPAETQPSNPSEPAKPATPNPVVTTPATPPASAPGYTASEVAVHSSVSSCWSIVNGEVYDLTSYISRHPGGEKEILRICGKDGTSAFEGQHGGESKPEKILASYKIGPLK